jgi:hypothetical protein
MWRKGIISNFEYLMHLNTYSGRTLNDISQYMVYPWTLQDYESSEIDLFVKKTRKRDKTNECI